ncbi:hypothetical protein [Arthrobacter sp. H-02-3]|uniref:hypothetical protein n=1 Tax=Arthrobacter sp. H-02-3 TaxID=2703675 RepID=UPI000DD202A7|nr:hypothetical protein [Arthrobacter sp. H-02-3]PVZ54056.1 hypothetical protein C9424_16275 [Arthrobacter sp. H-02-3]
MTNPLESEWTCFVEANEPHLIEENLNAALDVALEHAMKDGRFGILVTRHGHTRFTVALSADVPYGQTMEENGPAS